MVVNPFIAGVFCTLFCELLFIVILAFIKYGGRK